VVWEAHADSLDVTRVNPNYPCRKEGVMETFVSDFIVVSIM
jgi:hypothetical protein